MDRIDQLRFPADREELAEGAAWPDDVTGLLAEVMPLLPKLPPLERIAVAYELGLPISEEERAWSFAQADLLGLDFDEIVCSGLARCFEELALRQLDNERELAEAA